MDSGYNSDPAFVIISMPSTEDKEKDGVSSTEKAKADADVADTADHARGDRKLASGSDK